MGVETIDRGLAGHRWLEECNGKDAAMGFNWEEVKTKEERGKREKKHYGYWKKHKEYFCFLSLLKIIHNICE